MDFMQYILTGILFEKSGPDYIVKQETLYIILSDFFLHNALFRIIEFIYIGLMSRVFANGPGDQGSIPGRVIPKTKKKWNLMPPWLTLIIIK